MKIGLVRRGYSPTGGAEAYLRRFADAARVAGHDCVLFATPDWPAEAWAQERVNLPAGSPRRFADAVAASRPREHCDLLFSLERIWECDVYRAGDGVHAEWLRRRAEFEPWWKVFARRLSGKHRALLELERALFSARGASVVIANSAMVQREIAARFAYPSSRIHVVYNGVSQTKISADARVEMRRELGLEERAFVLLFAGSGWERKGLRYAIEAVNAAASGVTLLVAGRGRTNGLPASSRVRFLGAVREMPRVLAAADAFILPTLYEPFSNACLEALAAGLPVITTNRNGFAEILDAAEGDVIADPRGTAELARAIDRWSDPARRAGVRAALVEKGTRFSIEENLRQTLVVLEQARTSA